tara:strand:- start:294 stop:704 length:411 start_codon:yes stop_codon:yes gene_type:complete
MGDPVSLYHAAWESKLHSILREGLLPGPDGCVYLAGPLPAHAAQFVAMRPDYDPSNPFKEIEIDGEMVKMPNMLDSKTVYAFEIDVDMLDLDLLQESGDHNPAFFQEDTQSFMYNGKIEPEWLEVSHSFDMEAIAS